MQMSAFQLRGYYICVKQLMQFCTDPIITEGSVSTGAVAAKVRRDVETTS